jgi:hypothetical protein
MAAGLAAINDGGSWGAALPVVIVMAIALLEAAVLPQRLWAKGAWLAAVGLCGFAALSLLQAHHKAAGSAAVERQSTDTAALHGLWSQWDELSQSLPAASGQAPAASFDSLNDAIASLSAKVASIRGQIAVLEAGSKDRSVDPETAIKLMAYLRQYGGYRAVVSCPPGDVEAYTYANQIANILRSAGWDANGPQATATEQGPAMAISLYVRNPAAPEAAKVLVDAFSRFNIPVQSGIAPNDAIPDEATVELYVAKKP